MFSYSIFFIWRYTYSALFDSVKVEGLCSNFDGDKKNDLMLSDGTLTRPNPYGKSHQIGTCSVPAPDEFTCSKELQTK